MTNTKITFSLLDMHELKHIISKIEKEVFDDGVVRSYIKPVMAHDFLRLKQVLERGKLE